MKIGCIIQARMGSTRLPKKILMPFPFGGTRSNLEWIVNRVSQSKKINQLIIATTDDSSDDEVEIFAENNNVTVYRGSVSNVLSRYYFAAKENNLDAIVRITGDCPCIDPEVIDCVIEQYMVNKDDYCSNTLERTFPHGLDIEIFSYNVLEEAYKNATQEYETEHVTPYIYKTNKQKFQISQVTLSKDYSDIRVTLDTYEDYMAICAIYQAFPNGDFRLNELLELFERQPWIKYINNQIVQKKQLDTLSQELEEILIFSKKQDLFRATSFLEGELNVMGSNNIN